MMADGELNQKGNPSLAIALPLSRDQQIGQAQRAVQAAFEDGITRQLLVLSLPLTGATEMDDWPGGVVQMYSAASPMAKSIMQALPTWAADAAADEGEGGEQTKPPPSGSGKRKVIEQIIDSGDSVGLLQSVADDPRDDAYAFVFPAVESLESIQQVDASAKSRLVALINPQWKSVADFGMFAKDPAEKYLAPYAPVYHLQSYIFKGLTCRLLRAYPNPWQLFKVDETMGSREFVTSWEERPSTAELESALFSAYGEPSTRDRIDTAVRLIKESGM